MQSKSPFAEQTLLEQKWLSSSCSGSGGGTKAAVQESAIKSRVWERKSDPAAVQENRTGGEEFSPAVSKIPVSVRIFPAPGHSGLEKAKCLHARDQTLCYQPPETAWCSPRAAAASSSLAAKFPLPCSGFQLWSTAHTIQSKPLPLHKQQKKVHFHKTKRDLVHHQITDPEPQQKGQMQKEQKEADGGGQGTACH